MNSIIDTTNLKSQKTERQFEIDMETTGNEFVRFSKMADRNIFGRTKAYCNWVRTTQKEKNQVWLFDRRNLTPPKTTVVCQDEYGNISEGPNFGTADYMGLSHHDKPKQAAIRVLQEYGIGSGGSPVAFGIHKYYMQIRKEMAEFWGLKGVVIYSTGWLAAYGAIRGLVKPNDWIVADRLSHNCIQEAIKATMSKNVAFVEHLNNKAYRAKVAEIREKYPDSGIFVITEGLFSMDSDTADLNDLQQICKQYEAFLMIDCAHDFGCMGETGKGTWEQQGLKDMSNVIVTATGSKSMSTNIGFVGCDNEDVIEYLKIFSPTYMFVNAISPIQAATALACLDIIRSDEGKRRRKQIQDNAKYLKAKFREKGYTTIGQPSPIVPVWIGNEFITRITARLMLDDGIIINPIEFPVVASGQARFRICVIPEHTQDQMDLLVDVFDKNIKKAASIIQKKLGPEICKQIDLSCKNYQQAQTTLNKKIQQKSKL